MYDKSRYDKLMGSLWVLAMGTRGGNAAEAPRARRAGRHVYIGVLGVDTCKLKMGFLCMYCISRVAFTRVLGVRCYI